MDRDYAAKLYEQYQARKEKESKMKVEKEYRRVYDEFGIDLKSYNTGDILFMRGSHCFGRFTQCCTRYRYDHAALVIRSEEGYIRTFEVNKRCHTNRAVVYLRIFIHHLNIGNW